MKKSHATLCVSLYFVSVGPATMAADWRYSLGLHDIAVPTVSSHTYGIDGMVSVSETTSTGIHLDGSFELLLDRDKDELDPDHIPVWWRMHLGADGRLTDISSTLHLAWVVDINTKANTVSCVEREIKALPGILARFDSGPLNLSLKAAAGYFFLEIDDDVAKQYGYTRDDFRHSTLAGSLSADATIELGSSWQLSGHAQQWRDSESWLENQYLAELRLDIDDWIRASELILSIEVNEYNLDPYYPANAPPGFPPILPWNDDQMIKFSFNSAW